MIDCQDAPDDSVPSGSESSLQITIIEIDTAVIIIIKERFSPLPRDPARLGTLMLS
jgi:hypothetical protein